LIQQRWNYHYADNNKRRQCRYQHTQPDKKCFSGEQRITSGVYFLPTFSAFHSYPSCFDLYSRFSPKSAANQAYSLALCNSVKELHRNYRFFIGKAFAAEKMLQQSCKQWRPQAHLSFCCLGVLANYPYLRYNLALQVKPCSRSLQFEIFSQSVKETPKRKTQNDDESIAPIPSQWGLCPQARIGAQPREARPLALRGRRQKSLFFVS
jgi:hypothetical protein